VLRQIKKIKQHKNIHVCLIKKPVTGCIVVAACDRLRLLSTGRTPDLLL